MHFDGQQYTQFCEGFIIFVSQYTQEEYLLSEYLKNWTLGHYIDGIMLSVPGKQGVVCLLAWYHD